MAGPRVLSSWPGLRLKGKAPRFSAGIIQDLSCERPFKFPRHLVRPLGVDNIIAMSDMNTHGAIFKWTQTRTRTRDVDRDADKDVDKAMDNDTDMDTALEYLF
jgi:hypothetical protein